jgi:hypothetical protein
VIYIFVNSNSPDRNQGRKFQIRQAAKQGAENRDNLCQNANQHEMKTGVAEKTEPTWMRDFLEKFAAGNADLSIIGMQRDRFKREWRELTPCPDCGGRPCMRYYTGMLEIAGGGRPSLDRKSTDCAVFRRSSSHLQAVTLPAFVT